LSLIDPEVKNMGGPGTDENLHLWHSVMLRSLCPPKYQPAGAGGKPPHINGFNVMSIRRQLEQMRSRLFDKQYDFMLHPGEWEPIFKARSKNDLAQLLDEWLGHDKPITVLDLSGVPSSVLVRLIGGILNIIYEALLGPRDARGCRMRPQLIVMEEAHRYLGKEFDNPARTMVQRIVKEGRKFGIGAMIVSQRPTESTKPFCPSAGLLSH